MESVPAGLPDELRDIASDIAREAGEFARTMRLSGVDIAGQKSSSVDIVTKADQATEKLIRERLAECRPHDAIFGEEGATTAGTSGLTWVVDPIDGTVNYLYGIPAWGVSVAVVEGDADPATWTALAGAVANASTGELFSAALGLGATCNDRALSVSSSTDLATSLVSTGFAYSSEVRAHQGNMMHTILPRVRDIRRIGACSLDLCDVADGRVDAFFEQTLSPWDHAAGALIAREAGAVITGFPGEKESRGLLVAAAPGIHAALLSLIVEAGAGQLPGL
jgi:myo-inositol-1(or 4)-monophosphatase